MNPAKCDDLDYINFLLASVDVFTCTEAARCYIDEDNSPSHDAFTRLLRRQPPDTKGLWSEVKDNIQPQKGFLCQWRSKIVQLWRHKIDHLT